MLNDESYEAADRVFTLAVINLHNTHHIIGTPEFAKAVKMLSKHRIWTTGMGKASLPAKKLASTLSSNGRPAAFIHSGEALHGDFGSIQKGDVLVAISNSGRTDEVLRVAIKAQKIGAHVILITGRSKNKMMKYTELVICYGEIIEACPLRLTPTTSIVVALVICDALAMAVQVNIGTTIERYAINHHAGYLGQKSRMGIRK